MGYLSALQTREVCGTLKSSSCVSIFNTESSHERTLRFYDTSLHHSQHHNHRQLKAISRSLCTIQNSLSKLHYSHILSYSHLNTDLISELQSVWISLQNGIRELYEIISDHSLQNINSSHSQSDTHIQIEFETLNIPEILLQILSTTHHILLTNQSQFHTNHHSFSLNTYSTHNLISSSLYPPPLYTFYQNESSASSSTLLLKELERLRDLIHSVETECVVVLREVVYSSTGMSSRICNEHGVIEDLFELIKKKACFDNGVLLIEDLLAARTDTFCLENVNGIESIIGALSPYQLAFFCRILTLTLFDTEEKQAPDALRILSGEQLLEKRISPAGSKPRTVERNHNVLLSIPDFIPRLVKLTCSRPNNTISRTPAAVSTAEMNGTFDTIDTALFGAMNTANFNLTQPDMVAGEILELLAASLDAQPTSNESVDDSWSHFERTLDESLSVLAMEEQIEQQDELQLFEDDEFDINSEYSRYMTSPSQSVFRAPLSASRSTRSQATAAGSVNTAESSESELERDSIVEMNSLAERLNEIELRTATVTDETAILQSQLESFVEHNAENGEDEEREDDEVVGDGDEDVSVVMSMKDMALASHKVEVLFVICSLLGGKRKLDAQESFSKAGLIPALMNLCERIDWTESCPTTTTPSLHGPECECSPENVLRVQFLRLLANFCDRDTSKTKIRQQLLSQRSRVIISHHELIHGSSDLLSGDGSIPDSFLSTLTEPTPQSTERDGLLETMTDLLMKCKPESTFKIGLTSCIEAYLRGASRIEQTLLASRGLLEFLLKSITNSMKTFDVNDENQQENDDSSVNRIVYGSTMLQTSFDMLGELCKFNRTVFKMMNEILKKDEDLKKSLLECISMNLIDSNVFLRALFLSLERFYMEDLDTKYNGKQQENVLRWNDESEDEFQRKSCCEENCDGELYDFGECEMWNMIEVNRTRFLSDLMCCVKSDEVNQENICCLNTALVILIFAEARSDLDELLDECRDIAHAASVLDHTIENELSYDGIVNVRSVQMENFKELLDFWCDYYRYRGLDVLSLESSSMIPFREWLRVVDIVRNHL